ncbi:MAG: hypothetical protein HUU29_00290 [Planctomycetaceae bacterium]|nr:hypothetical protein [Planctomycetaceae bacterium]
MADVTLIPVNARDTLRKKLDGYHLDRIGQGGAVSEELARSTPLTEVDQGGANHFTIHCIPGVLCAVKPRSAALRSIASGGYLYRAHGNAAPDIQVGGSWQDLVANGWSA